MAVRVFIVEDIKATQELVRDLLESVGGFEVVGIAGNETSATEWLLRHRGGWDLASQLRAYLRAFPGRVPEPRELA